MSNELSAKPEARRSRSLLWHDGQAGSVLFDGRMSSSNWLSHARQRYSKIGTMLFYPTWRPVTSTTSRNLGPVPENAANLLQHSLERKRLDQDAPGPALEGGRDPGTGISGQNDDGDS